MTASLAGRIRTLLAATFLLTLAPLAQAQVTIMMQVPGITGESTLNNFIGWVELNSATFGAYRNDAGPGSQTQTSGIQVSKRGDSTSPLLFGHVVTGSVLGTQSTPLKIRYLRPIQGDLRPFMEIDLEGARFESIHNSSSGESPVESLSLVVDKFKLTTRYYNPGTGVEDVNKLHIVTFDFQP
jgi:type VI protein secretion system component Hcp